VRDRGERGFETMTTRTIIRSISDLLDTAGYARTDPAGVLHLDTAVELLPDGTVSLGNPSSDGYVGGAWYSDGSYPRLADNERRIPCPRRRLTAQDVERYWDEAED
jgi:hypothetical protein